MSKNDQAIEKEIQAKGLTAPRVTLDHIKSLIVGTYFINAGDACFPVVRKIEEADSPLDLLTFCVLVLKNGFTVTGESACASPENFDAEIGKKIAYENAVNKIWLLEGYLLRERLSQG